MKLSQLLHVASIFVGLTGVVSFLGALIGGSDNLVFGISKIDALLCASILILIATWLQIATIHHALIEKYGKTI